MRRKGNRLTGGISEYTNLGLQWEKPGGFGGAGGNLFGINRQVRNRRRPKCNSVLF